MSDNEKSSAATSSSPQFTPRELQLLAWAMQSLKSGPPEIDNDKLANFAGMSNSRSAGNAWAKIKAKLMTPSDGSAPPTPKKGGAKKAAAKDVNDEDGADTPKKTPRKRPAKKQDVDGDASPKKKGRGGKKTSDDEEAAHVKAESDSSDDMKPNNFTVKLNPADVEDEV
ncbi:hypothetical protein ACN47E_002993 [Coniothyrium glycines]